MSAARTWVIPCFNEEHRLDVAQMASLADGKTRLLFVDDGSRDGTRALLERIAAADPSHLRVLALPVNGGKAEAVRAGMARAIDDGAAVVGYLDADLSTPIDEARRLAAVLDDKPGVAVVLGSRVSLLGRDIDRQPSRHYLGRVFATAASLGLGLRVYDTQCGAKVFRVTPSLRAALDEPFTSRWAFDVELLARLLRSTPPSAFEEVPLRAWRDVSGSKMTGSSMLRAGADLLRITVRERLRNPR
jgi:dolichyl-phosphate beta-glucosyltransferase